MLTNPLRAAVLAGALSLLTLGGSIPAASANEPARSKITTPASPVYVLANESESSPPPAFKVEGTTNTSENLELRCYYGPKIEESITVIKNVKPEEVKPDEYDFSAEVAADSLRAELEPGFLISVPCVLRAVPTSEASEPHPPATAAEEEASDPFRGPRVIPSSLELFPEHSSYEFEANTLTGFFGVSSVGECGLLSNLYAPETLLESEGLFDCDAALYWENGSKPSSSTRSELQVDGANAYTPAAAHALENELGAKTPLPGAPDVTVKQTWEAGLVTIHEADPIVKCSPSTAFPPTTSGCTSFVPTGVTLEREWKTGDGDQVAAMTDVWSSTDGASHSLNALYDQSNTNGGKTGGAYQFPGSNVFTPVAAGQTLTLPAGLGAIYYEQDAEAPAEGYVHPQGAIVYDTPPTGPVSVALGSAAEHFNELQMPYQATIPAGGAYTLHMTFVQGHTHSEVVALASEALDQFPASAPPTLTITAPANGTTVSTPNVTVTGTVSDKRALTSFTVDGHAVSVGAGGAWSTSVPLLVGSNTIAVAAADQAGFSTDAAVSVTYTPIAPVAHASQVGSAHGANGEVTFTVACAGTAGTSCELESTATTVERTHNGRLVAVSAARRRRGNRNRSAKVTVGSSKVTIPAGQRVTVAIALNATGSALLARFGTLPVHLTVVSVSAGNRMTVIAQNLTVTPHRRRRHHRRHRHRR